MPQKDSEGQSVKLVVLVMVILALLLVGGCTTTPRISWDEAQDHLGEEAAVCGPVMGTYYDSFGRGTPTYLHMGKPYPDPDRVVAVIWGPNRAKFPQPPEEYYSGKSICVTGSIAWYAGFPWVVLESPTQLEVQ